MGKHCVAFIAQATRVALFILLNEFHTYYTNCNNNFNMKGFK